MKQFDFDNYRFGINTEVKWHNEWFKIAEIDFDEGLKLKNGDWVIPREIDDIREVDFRG